MIRSMTGFGRATYNNDNREYIIEIKSVNNRYCDINIKMPRSISYLEDKVKKEILNNVTRGKIDIFITFNNNSTKGRKVNFNNELAKMYVGELTKLAKENNINTDISITELTKFPEMLNLENNLDEELIWEELKIPLLEAIQNFISMKEIEGEKIYKDLENRISNIEKTTKEILEKSTGLINEYIVKLKTRIKELLEKDTIIDENRLAMETVIYADKSSVQEELTRLDSHISQFRELLKNNVSGKKIDFLIQEMNREINTIGSKSCSLEITNKVIDMKTELEDIREQVQNIE